MTVGGAPHCGADPTVKAGGTPRKRCGSDPAGTTKPLGAYCRKCEDRVVRVWSRKSGHTLICLTRQKQMDDFFYPRLCQLEMCRSAEQIRS